MSKLVKTPPASRPLATSSPNPMIGRALMAIGGAGLAVWLSRMVYVKSDFIMADRRDHQEISIATNNIRWFRRTLPTTKPCFVVCTDPNGCWLDAEPTRDKYVVCQDKYPASFKYLEGQETV